MARIKIEDLPVLEDLSPKEKKGIFGGSLRVKLAGTTSRETTKTDFGSSLEKALDPQLDDQLYEVDPRYFSLD